MKRALRSLAARPGFTAVAIATLALGFGVNAAIFSLTRSVLIKTLPYRDVDRLVLVGEVNQSRGISFAPAVPANYLEWRDGLTAFERTAAWRFVYFTLSGRAEGPVRMQGVIAEPTFFQLFGVSPMLGRAWTDDDSRPGRDHVVLLSYAFWRREFAADPDVVGRDITVDGTSCTIVGVLPESFKFFRVLDRELDVWRPFAPDRLDREHSINLYAKLNRGVTLDAARIQLATAFASLPIETFRDGWTTSVGSVTARFASGQRPVLLALEAAVALVMCIAAANVASLVLAVATGRRKDFAVRVALGATRWRLATEMGREMLLLAGAGALVGVVLAQWIVDLLNQSLSYRYINRVEPFRVDLWVLGFTACLALMSASIFALLPSQRAATADIVDALKESAPGSTSGAAHRRLQAVFVVAELALAVALLTAALELTRGAWTLTAMSRGVDVDRVTTAQLSLSGPRYEDASRMTQFVDAVLGRLMASRAVEAASLVNYPPLSSIATSYPVAIENHPSAPGREPRGLCWIVAPRYFATVGIPIIAGRDFTAADSFESPGVAIVSRTFAGRFWPDGDAIGRQVTVLLPESDAFWIPRGKRRPLTIIGVANNVRIDGVGPGDDDPQLYLAYRQFPTHILTVVVRPRGDPASATAVIRDAVRAVDPDQPTYDEKTLSEVRKETFSRPREVAWLIATFAVLAVVLSGIGVYGVISYSVTRRTREIGIRIALGAAGPAVVTLIVREMAQLVAAGIAIGMPLSLALGRVIQSQVAGTGLQTSAEMIAAAALLTVIAVLAAYLPARGATRLDPTLALRAE
jgi:predicted permease